MIETPKILHTESQQTAVIPLVVPRAEIQQVMGPGIDELIQTLATQGIAPQGAVFTHHFHITPDTFDFEIGVPVGSAVSSAGRVRPGWLRGGTVARTIYFGGYEGLSEAWSEFGAWIAAEGLTPASDLWESYLIGPESELDALHWQTELVRPLIP